MPVDITLEKEVGEAPKVNHLGLVTNDGVIPLVPGSIILMNLPEEGSGLGNIIPFVLKKVKRDRIVLLLDGKEFVYTASKGVSRADAQAAYQKMNKKTKEK